jgi:hypothetical protein
LISGWWGKEKSVPPVKFKALIVFDQSTKLSDAALQSQQKKLQQSERERGAHLVTISHNRMPNEKLSVLMEYSLFRIDSGAMYATGKSPSSCCVLVLIRRDSPKSAAKLS